MQFFPLYLHKKPKKANINKILLKELKETYNKQPRAEEIFQYIYAVSHSTNYRLKYEAFLKIDFPRIPFTTDYALFIEISKLGKKLVNLHLMKSELLSQPLVKFQGIGNNMIKKVIYNKETERVYVNATQYFEGIRKDVWEYHVGGYHVLHKWLKDRKKRKISLDEIKHYCKIATALQKTIEIQEEVDMLYPKVEKDVIPFKEEKLSLEKYAK